MSGRTFQKFSKLNGNAVLAVFPATHYMTPHRIRFKLLLGPKGMHADPAIPSIKLPPGKQDVLEVYADFYRYMYGHARTYIEQTHANGDLLWESFGEDIDFILSHPNGWEGAQQSAMRRAAIKAGLVPDTPDGRERVKFVTEGEASFHCCISSGTISDSVEASLISFVLHMTTDTTHRLGRML